MRYRCLLLRRDDLHPAAGEVESFHDPTPPRFRFVAPEVLPKQPILLIDATAPTDSGQCTVVPLAVTTSHRLAQCPCAHASFPDARAAHDADFPPSKSAPRATSGQQQLTAADLPFVVVSPDAPTYTPHLQAHGLLSMYLFPSSNRPRIRLRPKLSRAGPSLFHQSPNRYRHLAHEQLTTRLIPSSNLLSCRFRPTHCVPPAVTVSSSSCPPPRRPDAHAPSPGTRAALDKPCFDF